MFDQSKYMREYRETLRDELIALLGGKCVKCDSTNRLEFDHVDPKTKLFNVSGFHQSREALLDEIKKCQLLCHTCHDLKTYTAARVRAEEIRKLYAAGGHSHRSLGRKFGITGTTVGKIVRYEICK